MIDFLGVMEMTECCCKYFLLFLVKKMSFCLEFEKKDILLHPSSRPGGGIGRRAGLKIQCPQQTCGFDSRPGYKLKIKELDENLTLFFCNPWDRGMGFLED